MAVVHFSTAIKTPLVNTVKTALDIGGTGSRATIKVYTGSMPATPETAVTSQTLLGTLTCAYPLGSESSGLLTWDTITQDSAADATGTATWARMSTGGGVACADLDVTATGAGGALQMNTVAIVAGGPISVSALTLTFS